MTDQDRIAELEIMLAHQGRTVEDLSSELARAFALIERHEKALKELAGRFLALEDAAMPRPEATRPPHY